MNDLLSKTFSRRSSSKSYMDLRRDSLDLEVAAGGHAAEMEMVGLEGEGNLSQFFQEVKPVKEEMEKVRSLLSALHSANEESKTITKSHAMKALRDRMDRHVGDVLRQAKLIKGQLEDLNRANATSRTIPGCEQGSSTDRTRMAITNGLRRSLQELMAEFQRLRQRMMSEYRETIERRYFTVTGKQADEETIDNMINTGQSETLLQNAIQEQGRGQIVETIKELQERHDTVMEIEKNLLELHQVFMDMAVLVEEQGEQLNNIEAAVQGASSFVKKGMEKLQSAKHLQRNTRKWKCLILLILIIIILIVVITLVVKFLPASSSNSSTVASPSST